jgi:DNA-binding GntR family transcriptional regulator
MVSESVNLTNRVYDYLKEQILSGNYENGSSITENSVGKELNVSRTPVREALRQLELGGLVKIVPNKGAVVQNILIDDIKNIYEIRSLIEGVAAAHAAKNASDEELARLKEIVELTEFYFSRGDDKKLRDLDGKFHQCLYEICHNRILKHILDELHDYGVRYREKSMKSKGRVEKTITEHKGIMNAVLQRDDKKAEQLSVLHVNNALKNILEQE